jgi:hypothetical protein
VGVVAAACRVSNEVVKDDSVKFRADGIEQSRSVVLMMLQTSPKSVMVDGKALPADASEFANGTLRIRFTNRASGLDVNVNR